jgi:cytosine/adenosine deaminase-related metal-dependent hydrolase
MIITGNGPVITNDPDNPFLEHGAVRVEGDDHRRGRAGRPSCRRTRAATTSTWRGRVILPGLINAHTHAYSHYARGLAASEQGSTFTGVLEKLWWKLDRLLETGGRGAQHGSTTFLESVRATA